MKKHDCFTNGDYQLLITDPEIYAYLRQTRDNKGIVVTNFSNKVKKFTLPEEKWKKVLANKVKLTNNELILDPWGSCALESKI